MFKRNAYSKVKSLNEERFGDLDLVEVDLPADEVGKYFLVIHGEELDYDDFLQIQEAREALPGAMIYFARTYKLAEKYTRDRTTSKSLITVTMV